MKTITTRDSILIFYTNKEENYLPLNEIVFFEIFQKVITIHCVDTKIKFICTMTELENLLRKEGFLRIHREYLINSQYVRKRRVGCIGLKGAKLLPVGRKYRASVKAFFEEKMAEKDPFSQGAFSRFDKRIIKKGR